MLRLSVSQLEREDESQAYSWSLSSLFPQDFDENAAATLWEAHIADARLLLSKLMRRNLITYDPIANRYRVHDLMRELAKKRLSAEDCDTGRLRLAEYYFELLDRAGELYNAGGEHMLQGLQLYDMERVNIEHLRDDWLIKNADRSQETSQLCQRYANAGYHVTNIRVPLGDRLKWLNTCIEAARSLEDRRSEVAILNNYNWLTKDDSGADVKKFEEALELARSTSSETAIADALCNKAEVLAANDPDEAIRLYKEALDLERKIDNKRYQVNSLANLARIYEGQNRYDEALRGFHGSLDLAVDIGNTYLASIARVCIGRVNSILGNSEVSIECVEKAYHCFEEFGDTQEQANSLDQLVVCYQRINDSESEAQCWAQLAELDPDDGQRTSEALDNLGRIYRQLGKFERALECYRRAQRIAEAASDRFVQARVICGIGHVFRLQEKHEQAKQCYRRAVDIHHEAEDKKAKAQLVRDIGYACHEDGHLRAAITFYEHALDFFREIADDTEISNTLNALGRVHLALGKPALAKDRFLEERMLDERGGDQERIAIACVCQGHAHRALDEIQAAISFYEEAIDFYGLSQKPCGPAAKGLGECYQVLQDHSAALQWYDRAASAFCQEKDWIEHAQGLVGVGQSLKNQCETKAALKAFEKVRKVPDTEFHAVSGYALGLSAVCHIELGHPPEARRTASEAVEKGRRFDDAELTSSALFTLGRVHECSGDVDNARRCFSEARNLAESNGLESIRRTACEALARRENEET